MHVAFPFGVVVAAIEIWIAVNIMAVLVLVSPTRKMARLSSLTVFAVGWMCVCGALRFLP